MQYTVILSHKPDGGFHVSAPVLPHWAVEVRTRDEGIIKAQKAIAEFMNHSEILSIDVPSTQPNGQSIKQSTGQFRDIPWEWFGIGKNDSSWDTLFDEIEQKRDETRGTD
jgi:predicted RNase H-like HicB family nuclease